MPIVGLTDRGAQFPQIGMLRKGAAKPNDRQPGRDLDHFRFEGLDDQVQAEFAAVYGPEPRQVNVYLPFATVDENFITWKEHWVKGGLKRRCDGQTCAMIQKPDGKYDQTPHACWCAAQSGQARKEDLCKPTGRLKVIIPELRRFAYIVALTGSIHDIIELHANLEAIEVSAGSLRGIPLVLRRVERSISMPGDNGQRVRRNKWLLHIEAAPRWVDLKMAALEHAALSQVNAGRTLPALELPALPAPVLADMQSGEVVEYGEDPVQQSEVIDAAPDPVHLTPEELAAQERDAAVRAMREAAKKAKRANPGIVLPGKDDVAAMDLASIRALTDALNDGTYQVDEPEPAEPEPAAADMLEGELPAHL